MSDIDPSFLDDMLEMKPSLTQPLLVKRGSTGADEFGIDELIAALSGSHRLEQLTDADCPEWYDQRGQCAFVRWSIRQEWRDSLKWRLDHDVDAVLIKPQPHFFHIKRLVTQTWLGLDNDGHLVTLIRPGDLTKTEKGLLSAGITREHVAAHSTYLHEYWINNKLTETGRLHVLIDVKGWVHQDMSIFPIIPSTKGYYHIIASIKIINAPIGDRCLMALFSTLLRPLIGKKATDFVSMVSDDKRAIAKLLLKTIPAGILPREYGGTSDLPFDEIPAEAELADYTRRLNRVGCIARAIEQIDECLPRATPTGSTARATSPGAATTQDDNARAEQSGAQTYQARERSLTDHEAELDARTRELRETASKIEQELRELLELRARRRAAKHTSQVL
jgi:hypothetical protein